MIPSIYIAEFIGTTLLLFLGTSVVANVNLKKTNAEKQNPWVLITIAWGFSVFVGVFVTGQFSGGHLNPAVSFGLAIANKFSWSLVPGYIIAQFLGAMFGSWLTYILYIDHYRETKNEDTVRGTFCTGPSIRNFKNNFFSEFIGTFVLVFGVFFIASPNIKIEGLTTENFGLGAVDALPVGILVWVIGISLGGTTGYAINPARDFGPRTVYNFLPRKNKKPDWNYSWIPILGPITGGIVAGFVYLHIYPLLSI